jgi:hypothetical protein
VNGFFLNPITTFFMANSSPKVNLVAIGIGTAITAAVLLTLAFAVHKGWKLGA